MGSLHEPEQHLSPDRDISAGTKDLSIEGRCVSYRPERIGASCMRRTAEESRKRKMTVDESKVRR